MPWQIRLEKVPDKVVNGKQTVVVGKIEFSNSIAVVSPLLPLNYSVVSVEARFYMRNQIRISLPLLYSSPAEKYQASFL